MEEKKKEDEIEEEKIVKMEEKKNEDEIEEEKIEKLQIENPESNERDKFKSNKNNEEEALSPFKLGSVEAFEVMQPKDPSKEEPQKKLSPLQISLRNFSYPGRFILTIYSFYSLIIVVGNILQYILIIGGILFIIRNPFAIFLYVIVFIFFCFLMSNVLIVPLWEFSDFPYFTKYNYWKNIINIWKAILIKDLDKDLEFIEDIPSILALLLFLVYIIITLFFYGENGSVFDIVNLVTNFLTLFHYVFYYISYLVLCLKFSIYYIQGKDFSLKLAIQEPKNATILQHVQLCKTERGSELHDEFGTFKVKSYNMYWHTYFYVKLIIAIVLIIVFIILGIYETNNVFSVISLNIWFLVFIPISLAISFPLIFGGENKSKCVCQHIWFYFEQNEESTNKRENKHKIFTLILLRVICNCFLLLVGIGFVFIFLSLSGVGASGMYSLNTDEEIKKEVYNDSDFEVSIASPMCYSSIHGLKFHQIIALINDAYYWDNGNKVKTNLTTENNENVTQSDFSKWYTSMFFDNKTERVIPHGELIYENFVKQWKSKNKKSGDDEKSAYEAYKETLEKEAHTKIVHYTVQSKEGYNVTVLSIKGTDTRGDIFVDAQLFLPSALLTLVQRLIPLVNDQNSYTARFLEFSLTLPFRTLKDFTIIDQYIQELKEVTANLKVNKRTIVTGHSLGGGLSKIVAKLIGKNSISLSGPGISMTSNIYDPPDLNRNFYSSFIDIIPDLDIVPRVERSGGASYRLNCRAGIFPCHSCERSLCMTMIACRTPYYREYCHLASAVSDSEIDDLVKLTET